MNGCMLERDGHCPPGQANEDASVAACSRVREVGTKPCSLMNRVEMSSLLEKKEGQVNSQQDNSVVSGKELDLLIRN